MLRSSRSRNFVDDKNSVKFGSLISLSLSNLWELNAENQLLVKFEKKSVEISRRLKLNLDHDHVKFNRSIQILGNFFLNC